MSFGPQVNVLHSMGHRDRMIAGFTTICTISAYHHRSCEYESCSGEMYSI
jgi:hypothetical protein